MLEDIIALRRVEVCDEGWHNFIKFITCATAGITRPCLQNFEVPLNS
jgi:hypothetical protein